MRVLAGDQELHAPFSHDGDLRVTGHVAVNSSLTVTGSLVVDGVLHDAESGCRITVGGDLTATGVFCAGDLDVGGDVTAGAIYCTAFPAGTLAGGTVRARLVMEDDYQVPRPGIVAEVYVDLAAWAGPDDDADLTRRLRGLLVDEAFDPEGFDYRDVFERMLAGEPVFRDIS